MADAKIGQGDVKITIGGEERTLKCCWEAASELSGYNGGLTALNASIARMDFNAIVAVVRWGLDIDIVEARKKTFETGVMDLWFPCSEFVINLANGGKPIKVQSSEEAAAPQ